jgi:hypothetical protein
MSRLARGRWATGQHQVPRPMTSTVWSFREGICFSPLTAPIEPPQVITGSFLVFREFPVKRPRIAHFQVAL